MRPTRPFLIASLILMAPVPAAVQATAQVTVDPNALNKLGGTSLPEPPPAKSGTHGARSTTHHYRHRYRHSTTGAAHGAHAAHGHTTTTTAPIPAPTTVPAPGKTVPGAKPPVVLPPAGTNTENKSGLGSSFSTVPVLPGAVPALPAPPKIILDNPNPKPKKAKPAPGQPPVAAPVAPPLPASAPPPAPQPAAPQPAAPQPATPVPAELSPATTPSAPATPKPAAAPPLPAKAPVAPAPAAPAPIKTPVANQNPLPPGADLLTLPYAGQDTDISGAVPGLIRDFVNRHGKTILYIVRAYASQPKGDDDPSTARRTALTRAQGVQAALTDAGVDPIHTRLLAIGNSGGNAGNAPADRVDLIAMPPAPAHSQSTSSP